MGGSGGRKASGNDRRLARHAPSAGACAPAIHLSPRGLRAAKRGLRYTILVHGKREGGGAGLGAAGKGRRACGDVTRPTGDGRQSAGDCD